MLHSNVDHNIAQLHHHAQRLYDEMNADPDTALQTVLILQAEAYEDIEPECPMHSVEQLARYVDYQLECRVEAMIAEHDALAYAHAFREEQYAPSLERMQHLYPNEYDVHYDMLVGNGIPHEDIHKTVLLHLRDKYHPHTAQDEHNEFFSGTYEQAEQELLKKRKEMIRDLGFLHEDDMVAQDKRAGDFLPDEAYFTDEELLGDTWDEFFDDQLPF